MVAIGCDPLVTFFCCGLETDNYGLLANVQMAKASD
jgi:hypothetical protein